RGMALRGGQGREELEQAQRTDVQPAMAVQHGAVALKASLQFWGHLVPSMLAAEEQGGHASWRSSTRQRANSWYTAMMRCWSGAGPVRARIRRARQPCSSPGEMRARASELRAGP